MIQWNAAWARLKRLAAFKGMNESDFRPMVYIQTFTPAPGGDSGANQVQSFPGGAVLLGITASAYIPTEPGNTGQSGNNRQLFTLNLTYQNQEAITPNGPVLADALLGGGDANLFPSRELVMAPNQGINCAAGNITSGAIVVHVAYHCMVPRYAS